MKGRLVKEYFLVMAFLLIAVTIIGCRTGKIQCNVRLIDTEGNQPVANEVLLFFGETKFSNKVIETKTTLDANGESSVQLQTVDWWVRINNTAFGTSITPKNLRYGGVFRLYGPPPTFNDTNFYPSKFVIEIKKAQ